MDIHNMWILGGDVFFNKYDGPVRSAIDQVYIGRLRLINIYHLIFLILYNLIPIVQGSIRYPFTLVLFTQYLLISKRVLLPNLSEFDVLFYAFLLFTLNLWNI